MELLLFQETVITKYTSNKKVEEQTASSRIENEEVSLVLFRRSWKNFLVITTRFYDINWEWRSLFCLILKSLELLCDKQHYSSTNDESYVEPTWVLVKDSWTTDLDNEPLTVKEEKNEPAKLATPVAISS